MVGKVGGEVNTDGVSNWRGHHEIARIRERGVSLGERWSR